MVDQPGIGRCDGLDATLLATTVREVRSPVPGGNGPPAEH